MTPAEIRRIQRAETLEELHEWADELLAQARRRRARHAPARKEKEAKRRARNATTGDVREAVFARARGVLTYIGLCECGCGRQFGQQGFHMDHFFGGSSRRESTTIDGCWALHPFCDDEKTANRPGRVYWLRRFRSHCERHAYAEMVAKCDRALALEEGQHHAARAAGRTE